MLTGRGMILAHASRVRAAMRLFNAVLRPPLHCSLELDEPLAGRLVVTMITVLNQIVIPKNNKY